MNGFAGEVWGELARVSSNNSLLEAQTPSGSQSKLRAESCPCKAAASKILSSGLFNLEVKQVVEKGLNLHSPVGTPADKAQT